MNIQNKVVFVTGANRGIGRALVEAALKHGAKKIYAAARKIDELPNFGDARVVPVSLDITDRTQVKKVAEQAGDVQVLINNAGSLAFASVMEGPMEMLMHDMEVNYFGTLSVTRAFAPSIAANGGGAIASISSIIGLAPMAGVGGYCASKAALFSAIQASRAELKAKNISVHGIFPGPIDTDMSKEMDMTKNSPADTAENILRGIEQGVEDIFPDPMSAQMAEMWSHDPKQLERTFAAF